MCVLCMAVCLRGCRCAGRLRLLDRAMVYPRSCMCVCVCVCVSVCPCGCLSVPVWSYLAVRAGVCMCPCVRVGVCPCLCIRARVCVFCVSASVCRRRSVDSVVVGRHQCPLPCPRGVCGSRALCNKIAGAQFASVGSSRSSAINEAHSFQFPSALCVLAARGRSHARF